MNIEKIYLDPSVSEAPLSRRLLERLKGIPVEIVYNQSSFYKSMETLSLSSGKRRLWLTNFRGTFLKPCPGTGAPYRCCNYWVINTQVGCSLDCSYCVLQSYLNFPLVTIYANIEKVEEEIRTVLESHPRRLFRVGTGELTDSLALNPFTAVHEYLIELFAGKHALLEAKTKTDFVGHLPRITQKNVVLSWSLNPAEVVRSEEFKTAPLEARLEAAERAARQGYRLGFHFDPLVEFEGWAEAYKELVQRLCRIVSERDVVWISLGSLRFPSPLKDVIATRFPRSTVTTGEFVRGSDGKTRYFRPLRAEMYEKIYSWIREAWPQVFIYLCMENEAVWEKVMGFFPEDNDHLDFLFHENLFRRFPDLKLEEPRLEEYCQGVAGR